jgi:hypothetical protein
MTGSLPDNKEAVVRRIGSLLGVAALTLAGAAVAVAQSAPAQAAVAGLVRVDQVGYLPGDGKLAYLMTSAPVHGVTFTVGDYQDGMNPCPAAGADRYAAFTGHGSRYVDDVRSWQTSEPALDMTGSAILGLALQQALG